MDVTLSGHNRAVESLYRDHHSWLRNWILSRLNCQEQAAELAQDTFVRLIQQRKAEQLREPKAYLSTLARGLIIDKLRRRSLEVAYLEALALQPEPVQICEMTRASLIETLVQIDQLLDEMTERSREIFLLAQFEGLSYVAISKQLGVSVNTVRKHFVRALSHCLMLLDD